MSPISDAPAGARPAASEPVVPSSGTLASDCERPWQRTLSVAAIGLFLMLSGGLLVSQREAALERAGAQAQREVVRLAAELEQSLRIAQVQMERQSPATDRNGPVPSAGSDPLVQALNLPFDLRPINPSSAPPQALPAGQWQPGLARQDAGQWVLPLVWRQPPERGGQTWEVRLQRQALMARLASERLPEHGSMSLFRIEDDGATTVLARYPLVERDQGRKVMGHVATALQQSPSGVIQVVSAIDGVPRIVGYHRLGGGADRLAAVYALPIQDVLAAWTAMLPAAIALTLLIAGVMAYGAWRLDRSVRALARSERHFQTLSDHMPDVVVRYDHNGCVLYANRAIEAATGWRPEALIGRTVQQIGGAPGTTTLWAASLQRVMQSGQPEVQYFSHEGPAGERHWEAQVRREPGPPGETPTVLVIARDITERHAAEARQRADQQLFETVFQAAPEAMSLSEWDSGRLLLVNDAFCQLFDRPREQLVGHSTLDLKLWRSPAIREELLERLARGERVRDASASSTRPDGQNIEVRYSAERVTVEGAPRLLLMFRDVTQLEADQRALMRSELRFRLAASHGQVWEWDETEGMVQPSEGFFTALGHPAPGPSELGKRLLELMHPDDRPRLRAALLRFFKGEGDYQLEFRACDAGGQYRWFDTRGDGLRDETGHVVYMAGTTFDITDRKALEEAQRQTLKHLDTVANASAALAWTVDAEQRPDWLNQPWLDFTGRDLAAECEAVWLDDLHPQDRERCAQVFNSAFEAREPYSMEYRLRRHDGEYRWLHEQGKPRHDADQRFIGYVGSCLDVTDLRRAEAVALERGAILEQVFHVIRDMLFVLDAEERFVFFQAGSEDRLYRKPEDFLGHPMEEVMPPMLVSPLRAAMQRAREEGIQELDYSLDLPVGTHFFNARLAWLPGGEQCMFLVRDTTEQQTALQARERLNDFVLLLFRLSTRFINLPVNETDQAINDALGDMGRFVDADRAYLFDYDFTSDTASNTHEWCGDGVSPAIDDLQGLPFELIPEWIGQHRQGLTMHVADVQALPEGNLRHLLESQGIRSLMALPLMDGERCLGFVGLDSVRNTHDYGEEETTLLRLFAQMLVNIRLRVEAEEKIAGLTEGLEHKVAERTAQLQDSVQQLRTVNRELESFTYSASHDLRTPLRGIEGFSALLIEEHADQLDEQGREYLRRIQRATLHMSQLVSDLLAYSRLQQMTEQIQAVTLADCVREVATPFRDELETRHGELQVQMPAGLQVLADPKGLAIVLRNLIDNALKFTPPGEPPRIRIEARPQDGRVLLSVSDQGIGFDMKHHDRIFGMFQRLHRQDQIPGTGIGLALVHKAVARMGGTIRAESAPGQGARFDIDLPGA